MVCAKCGKELPADAQFCAMCGASVPRGSGLQVDQEATSVQDGGSMTGLAAAGGVPTGVDANIKQKIGTVGAGGAVVGAAFGAPGSPLHIGGEQHYGEYVGGDRISIGDVSNAAVAVGRGASATQGVSGDELARLFAPIYQRIEVRPDDGVVEKEEIKEAVEKIETEVAKGEEAQPKRLELWFRNLAAMAPDILDVTAKTLVSPALGIAEVVKKVAARAQAEAQAARST